MADFSKTNLSKFAVISVKRRQKVGFSGPKGKGEKECAKRKIGGKEKKAMVALLDFILATLEKKKMLHSKGPFVGNVFKHPARCVINILKLIVIIPIKLLPT